MHVTDSTPVLARPGIEKIVGTYNTQPGMISNDLVGEEINTSQSFFRVYTEGDFGYAATINEGTPMTYDDWEIPYTMDITPKLRVIGWESTRLAQESDQYGLYAKATKKLRLSLQKTMNRNVADMFNNCTSTTAPYPTPDGVAWISTAHLISTGATGSNRPAADVALGALTLEQGVQELNAQVGHRGDPDPFQGPFNLIVPTGLAGVANRVVNASGLAQTTSLNEPNYGGSFVSKVVVVPWLTDTNNWFLIPANKSERNHVVIRRRAPQLKTQYDINIDADRWRLDEMYAIAPLDWRRSWASLP